MLIVMIIKEEDKKYDAYVCSNGNTLYYVGRFYDP